MLGAMEQMRDLIDAELRALLRPRTRAALINYPNHHNVGDPALYLGTVRTLRRLGVNLTYRCEQATYSREQLGTELRRGTEVILINGGGNLGDQYQQQVGREQVLADFPGVPVIQLPQSIWFQDPGRLRSFAAIVRSHGHVTLMLRDTASLELARANFNADTRLCPDMALGLGPIPRPRTATQDMVWLKRTDRESAVTGERVPAGAPAPIDWTLATPDEAVGDQAGRELLELNRQLRAQLAQHPTAWAAYADTFEPLAERRLDYGLGLLAAGRVVVSDRLHAIILARLMGLPAVGVDNANHKLSAFFRTWRSYFADVVIEADHATALERAQALI